MTRPAQTTAVRMRWEQRGLIRVAVRVCDAAHVPEYDWRQLIACPTCHAKITEVCRTRSGHTTTEHDSRLVSRRCVCGETVQPRRSFCSSCRAKRDQASKNEHGARRRAVARMAAS